MKQLALVISLFILFAGRVNSQSSDFNLSKLNLGTKVCVFRFTEHPDTVVVRLDSLSVKGQNHHKVWHINPVTLEEESIFVKDSPITVRQLTLIDSTYKSVHIRKAIVSDTVTEIDPVTLAEKVKVIPINDIDYYINAAMSYEDFIELLKSKMAIKNPKTAHQVSSVSLYYESIEDCGFIQNTSPENIPSKIKTLSNGGFVLIYPEVVDGGSVKIDSHGRFLALINIKKSDKQ
jgi:hypothetical protein